MVRMVDSRYFLYPEERQWMRIHCHLNGDPESAVMGKVRTAFKKQFRRDVHQRVVRWYFHHAPLVEGAD